MNIDRDVNIAAGDLKPAMDFFFFRLFICFVFLQVWFVCLLVLLLSLVFIITTHSKGRTQKEEMLTTLSSCVRHAVPGRSENREKVRGEKKKRGRGVGVF